MAMRATSTPHVGIGLIYRYVDDRVGVTKERFTGRFAGQFAGPAPSLEAGF
jgi:hypothetical protein